MKVIRLILVIFFFLCLFVLFSYLRRIYLKKISQSLNVIIISQDTLRPDHMGVYGYEKNTTPNTDLWSKDAAIFTDLGTVVPVTSTSFAALMTGTHPFTAKFAKTGKYTISIDKKTETLAKLLKKNNYSTAAFVSNRFLWPDFNNINKGFDKYNYIDQLVQNRKNYTGFLDESLRWIKENKKKKFFLWIHMLDPHTPYLPPKELRCKYSNDKGNCKKIESYSDEDLEKTRQLFQGCQKKVIAKENLNIYESLYDSEINWNDQYMKKILDTLRENKLDKNSLVVFYSDHGEGFDHNYYFEHGDTIYNSSLKIPLIIKHPYIRTNGKKIDIPIQNIDIFPTLLDLLGISAKGIDFDGKSFSFVFYNDLLSLIDLNKFKQRKYIYSVSDDFRKYSLYDGRYKFIFSLKTSCLLNNQTEELYDLKNDPEESQNLVKKKNNLALKFSKTLKSYLSAYGLPGEIKSTSPPPKDLKDVYDKLKSLGY